jgi:hypothetical protein
VGVWAYVPSVRFRAALPDIHFQVLDYGESEYVREFGMTIANEPLRTQARIINAPTLRYHQSSKQPSAVSILFLSLEMRRF